MQKFTVDLRNAKSEAEVVASFNEGLIVRCGGSWCGGSWDAFHDYLSWPDTKEYELVVLGWNECFGLSQADREMMQTIFDDNSHVKVIFV